MSSSLAEVFEPCRDRLAATLHDRLHGSTAVHYRHIDAVLLRQRADRLVDRYLASLGGRPGIFIDYVRGLALDRIHEGFFLREIQFALSLLEEQAWELTVDLLPARDHVEALSVVTGVIGAAKDQLAQVFLDHLEGARGEADDLRRRCEVLAAGTEDGPVTPAAYLGSD